jgi:hypothetical protein
VQAKRDFEPAPLLDTGESSKINEFWIRAFAGMTDLVTFYGTIKVDLP